MLDAVRRILSDHQADAMLVSHAPDVRWACGFTGSNGVLVVTRDGAHLVTDGRYRTQASREVRNAQVHVPGYQLLEHAAEHVLPAQGRVLLQGEHVTLAVHERLRALLPEAAWVAESDLLVRHVAAKREWEIDRIRAAQRITDEVFEAVLPAIRPGVSEKDIAAEIVYQHLRRGAERMSFEPIVGSGPNGALPHARPGDRRLKAGDLVVLDFGCVLDGYASDMTRTVAVGEPGPDARRVYDVVLRAQQAALDVARAGITSRDLDAAARDVIAEAGYAEAFAHSLGHGIGLQTHEWPTVSFRSEAVLPAGACVTIEPGIYLPDRLGVRIEDIVVLREDGCENLTRSTKELLVL